MLSLEGRQLGNYTVTRRIRAGGMGAVYEGRQRTAFDRRVAIKVILGTYASDPDMRRRFAREAKTIARLHHPHILPLIEFGDEQGVLYLVMPFIEGGTLTGYLRRHLPDIYEVATIFTQVLDAVEYAHDEGLIHRDIKSSNVLLESRRSGPPYAYLADFGLVRTNQQARLESSYAGTPIPLDQVPGTPQYMAPEQTLGIVTPLTDIYALGVLLYQMLTGELPFNDPDDIEVIKQHLYVPPPNPRETDASIPAELGAVVTRAMAKRPEQRFANVGEFRTAFLAALDRPTEDSEVRSFDSGPEDFAFPEPGEPVPEPPQPRASARLSQPLRLPPEPIEFVEPAPPAVPRRARVTGEPRETAAHRAPVTGDQRDDTPRRARVTGEARETARRARVTDEPGEAPVKARRPRARVEKDEQAGSGEPHPRSTANKAARAMLPGAGQPRPASAKTRNTLALAQPLPGQRSPASGVVQGKRRLNLLAVSGLLVSVILILLLLLPRVFGLSLFPPGFPLLGAPAFARISLTVKTASMHDTFLLTASPQTAQANATTRVMPDRSVSGSARGQSTVPTSGLRSSGGTQARGTLHFDNSGPLPVNVSGGFIFTTSNHIQVRLQNDVTVPARFGDQDGTIDSPGEVVRPGQDGNIQAGALNSPCCGGRVIVSNPAAFSGGSDGSITHLVAQSDLDSVKNQLASGLRQQAAQQISSQLRAGEVQAGQPAYSTGVTSDQPVGAAADQVTVTVTVNAAVLVYNVNTANDLARQLLANEVEQSPALGPAYRLRGSLNIPPPTVEQQGSSGQLYLSISAAGLWAYVVTPRDQTTWRQAIKGASLPLAQNYLSTRPGIAGVRIDLPFGTDHLPADETQIVFAVTS